MFKNSSRTEIDPCKGVVSQTEAVVRYNTPYIKRFTAGARTIDDYHGREIGTLGTH